MVNSKVGVLSLSTFVLAAVSASAVCATPPHRQPVSLSLTAPSALAQSAQREVEQADHTHINQDGYDFFFTNVFGTHDHDNVDHKSLMATSPNVRKRFYNKFTV